MQPKDAIIAAPPPRPNVICLAVGVLAGTVAAFSTPVADLAVHLSWLHETRARMGEPSAPQGQTMASVEITPPEYRILVPDNIDLARPAMPTSGRSGSREGWVDTPKKDARLRRPLGSRMARQTQGQDDAAMVKELRAFVANVRDDPGNARKVDALYDAIVVATKTIDDRERAAAVRRWASVSRTLVDVDGFARCVQILEESQDPRRALGARVDPLQVDGPGR